MAFPCVSGRVEHGREQLVDDGSHRNAAELADADEPREPPELQVGAREAVVEDQAQAVGVAEDERGADAVHRRIDVQRVLQVEQIEQVALADAQDLRAPLDGAIGRRTMTTAMFPSNGSPWDDCTPLARTWSSRVDFGPSQSRPHWPVMLPPRTPISNCRSETTFCSISRFPTSGAIDTNGVLRLAIERKPLRLRSGC